MWEGNNTSPNIRGRSLRGRETTQVKNIRGGAYREGNTRGLSLWGRETTLVPNTRGRSLCGRETTQIIIYVNDNFEQVVDFPRFYLYPHEWNRMHFIARFIELLEHPKFY
ncbi:unnamed protein product [Meloidogyne enterolobii]|uniref:Uncharacterized protein n=1 Tax=Meloidogyne enterolobii TaxID=390850 RepID=A0ACB1B2M0_MELEN